MAVPIQSPPPPSYSDAALQRMEAERKLLADEKFTGWAVIWTLFGFKLGTIALILIVGRNFPASRSSESMAYIASSTWYWLFIPVVALSGAIVWRLRLRKARKNAEQLRRSEFSTINRSELSPLSEKEKERLRQVKYLPEHDR